jgi:hypothetical protein
MKVCVIYDRGKNEFIQVDFEDAYGKWQNEWLVIYKGDEEVGRFYNKRLSHWFQVE